MGVPTFIFSSCSENKGNVPRLGRTVSGPFELLLVVNKEWLSKGAGQALAVVLNSPIEGLPQPEPHFRITTVDPYNFDGTFKAYANVIVVKVGKEYPEKRVSLASDAYCKNQLLMYLEAPDDESFVELIRERAELILSTFDAREIARERELLEKKHNARIRTHAQKQFGITLYAPIDIEDIKVGKDFFWSSSADQDARVNLCVYSVPLRAVTTAEDFIALRDSVMKANIPGRTKDMWMETDPRSVIMHNKNIGADQHSVAMFCGLWDMKNDAMGGPFVSYVQVDNANERLLVSEGFVFAPNKDKRAMIRQLEASLQTLVLAETDSNTQ